MLVKNKSVVNHFENLRTKWNSLDCLDYGDLKVIPII
jgi:hypothetical protein